MRSLRAVTSAGRPSDDPGARARERRNSAHAAICDVLEPWAHGTVARAPRYPSFWDFNVVRVEEEPRMSVDELVAFADEALAGLPHRRVDFDQSAGAESVRAEKPRLARESAAMYCTVTPGRTRRAILS